MLNGNVLCVTEDSCMRVISLNGIEEITIDTNSMMMSVGTPDNGYKFYPVNDVKVELLANILYDLKRRNSA